MFSSKTNLNLVLEFLDTDLELVIKDRSLVFLPADIKSWMAMTFRGLEFCHRNWILHRVRVDNRRLELALTLLSGLEAEQSVDRCQRAVETCRFWSGPRLCRSWV